MRRATTRRDGAPAALWSWPMEKLVYMLIGQPSAADPDLAPDLCRSTVPAMLRLGGRSVQVNVTDPVLGHPFGVEPAPGADHIVAAVSAWVDSAEGSRVASALPVAPAGSRWHGWLVCEAEPRPNRTQRPDADGRVPGFAQMMALIRPERMPWGEWRSLWQGRHTAVAVNTQAVFRYVQNIVFRPLTPGAPPYAAIGEECFPAAAATDLHVFFDAVGDDARLARHMAAMSESCDRFMDGSAPVSWTTEWVFEG